MMLIIREEKTDSDEGGAGEDRGQLCVWFPVS